MSLVEELISKVTGSGLTNEEALEVANIVWDVMTGTVTGSQARLLHRYVWATSSAFSSVDQFFVRNTKAQIVGVSGSL